MTENLKKPNKLQKARSLYFKDESKYAHKKELEVLCKLYEISPSDLFDFIEKTDIEHTQSDAQSTDYSSRFGTGFWSYNG